MDFLVRYEVSFSARCRSAVNVTVSLGMRTLYHQLTKSPTHWISPRLQTPVRSARSLGEVTRGMTFVPALVRDARSLREVTEPRSLALREAEESAAHGRRRAGSRCGSGRTRERRMGRRKPGRRRKLQRKRVRGV